ncbi:MAG: EAL domain-containing protein [Treponema sp.]|nr:EAL domain-containing protein [Treponema sp.]
MKFYFLLLLAISLSHILSVTVLALRKNSVFSRSFAFLGGMASFSVSSYIVTLFYFGEKAGLVTAGVFFASLDWLLLLFLNYVFIFTRNQNVQRKNISQLKNIYFVAGTLDTVSLLLNAIFKHAFLINPSIDNAGDFICWIYSFKLPYNLHLIFCYIIVLHIVLYLVYRTFTNKGFYRRKYFSLLMPFVFLIILNVVFILFKWNFDYSLIFYAVLGAAVFYLTFYSIPLYVEREMRINIASCTEEECIVCYDLEGKVFYVNPHANEILEKRADIRDKVGDCQEQFILSYGRASQSSTWQYKFENDGNVEIYSFDFKVLYDSKGRLAGSFLKFEDKTQEILQLKQQQYNATHDLLTGLYNSQTFSEKVHDELIENPEEEYLLIATDIENFKLINDLFGPKRGDEILKCQASMFSEKKYGKCIYGRISADKFALLIRESKFNPDELIADAKSVQNGIKEIDYQVKIYLGVYRISDNHENVQNMIDKAFLAIRKIYGSYEKTLAYYDSSLIDDLMLRQRVLNDFQNAINRSEFCIYLQGQFDRNQKLIGCESLTRWNHPERGMLSPSEFMEPLEKSGFIYRLDDYIWESSVKILSEWKQKGISAYISINISPRDFYHIDVLGRFRELLQKYDFDPEKLNIEITETQVVSKDEESFVIINGLKELGFCIELDDFGCGYSSFKTLEDFDFDVLKIDMEFLHTCKDTAKAQNIIRSIIKMAKTLGIKTVTEGVEQKSQFDFLCEAGCDVFQGYFFSKPISVEEFTEKFLEEK